MNLDSRQGYQKTSIQTTFGLIRHAPTVWNAKKRIQGQADSSLTADGVIRARAWGAQLARFDWDRILASDSGRAKHTARLINETLQVGLSVDPALREQDWGSWTGRPLVDIAAQAAAQIKSAQSGWHFRPPGGEDRRSVMRRAQAALERAAAAWPGRRVLVVTHQGLINCLIYGLLNRRFTFDEPAAVKADQLHCLVHGRDGLTVRRINVLALETTTDSTSGAFPETI